MNQQRPAKVAVPQALAARLVIGAFIVLGLTGCFATTPITSNASHVFQPTLRASVGLGDEVKAPAEPHTGHAFEFSWTRAKGGGDQTLVSGQPPVLFNNTTFNAPQQLRNDFDFNFETLSYRWRKFFRESPLGLEVSGGLGRAEMGLTVASPTQRTTQHFVSSGAQGGVAFIWRIQSSTSFHVRISAFAANSDTGITDAGHYELFLAQAMGDNLALRAGFSKWEVNGDSGLSSSHFKATFSGPVLDLGLNF